MDLREKIAEALYEPPTGASGMSKLLAEDAHERRVTAVMEVVEGEVERSHTLLLMVGHVRAELADYFEEESTDTTEGYVARILARVRELEDENQRMRDDIASRIVEEERSVQEQITKEPLNSWLAGVLFGLQRSRDIVTFPAREIAEEEA